MLDELHSFWINENKCVFTIKHTRQSRVESAVLDNFLGASCLARHTWWLVSLNKSRRNVGWTLKALEGHSVSLKSPSKGLRPRRGSCYITKKIRFPIKGLLICPSKQINDFLPPWHTWYWIACALRVQQLVKKVMQVNSRPFHLCLPDDNMTWDH